MQGMMSEKAVVILKIKTKLLETLDFTYQNTMLIQQQFRETQYEIDVEHKWEPVLCKEAHSDFT